MIQVEDVKNTIGTMMMDALDMRDTIKTLTKERDALQVKLSEVTAANEELLAEKLNKKKR